MLALSRWVLQWLRLLLSFQHRDWETADVRFHLSSAWYDGLFRGVKQNECWLQCSKEAFEYLTIAFLTIASYTVVSVTLLGVDSKLSIHGSRNGSWWCNSGWIRLGSR